MTSAEGQVSLSDLRVESRTSGERVAMSTKGEHLVWNSNSSSNSVAGGEAVRAMSVCTRSQGQLRRFAAGPVN